MATEIIAKGGGLPQTLTNPLTTTTGVAFTPVITVPDPVVLLSGCPDGWGSLYNKAFQVRAAGLFSCINGTTPSLSVQFYIGGIAGTQVATTGAVAVGGTQPSSGSWYLEGIYVWDSVSGLNGIYRGFICGQNSIATSKAQAAVANVTAATYPSSVAFTCTGLFSATGSSNTVSLTEFLMELI